MSREFINSVNSFEILNNSGQEDLYKILVEGKKIKLINNTKEKFRKELSETVTKSELKNLTKSIFKAVEEQKICDDTDLPENWGSNTKPISSIENVRVIGKHMDKNGIILELIGEHLVEDKTKDTDTKIYRAKPHGSLAETVSKYIQIPTPKAKRQLNLIKQLINMREITPQEPTLLSSFKLNEDDTIKTYELWIEKSTIPADINLSTTYSIKLNCYEIGCDTTDENTTLRDNISYNTSDKFTGDKFKLESKEDTLTMTFASLKTITTDDGLAIPAFPFDEGYFKISPGTYRVWVEKPN